ncbi:YcaO-like family protein [Dickeya dianthicola]|uniref:YcaO-like family protein n=1 Tax=Dickeya dianthicola TaxID=204039 RepID=UPI001F60E5AA|nr:YcaO-like family protein [Dickeya dianthicola]MCI4204478.1 YcaO-like family protein [Dickeya dianthicola]MCI4212757.1 YcaO-like family protein [Dickeya dianthicola]
MKTATTPSLRRYTEKEVVALALPLRQRLGISRLTSVGEFINLPGVSIVNAVRTEIKKGQISSTQGKGRSLIAATCSALMEAYERHCACWCEPAIFHHQATTDDKQTLQRLGFAPECDIQQWIKGYEWHTGREQRIPAIEVQFPYHGADRHHANIQAHTSGLACGGSLEEATCFAIMESIERNTTSLFYKHCLSKICADFVDLSTISRASTMTLWEHLNDKGYESFALRIHGPLPTYYVALYDPVSMGPKFMIAGSASGFTESEALDAAMMEAIQGLVVSLQASREDLHRQEKKYRSQSFFETSKFSKLRALFHKHYANVAMPSSEQSPLEPSPLEPSPLEPSPSEQSPQTLTAATQFLAKVLEKQGVEDVYMVDLSLNDLPFHTVKAVIPGLYDWHVNPGRVG